MQVKDRVREDDGDKQELVLTLVASADEVKEAADKFFAEIAQRGYSWVPQGQGASRGSRAERWRPQERHGRRRRDAHQRKGLQGA